MEPPEHSTKTSSTEHSKHIDLALPYVKKKKKKKSLARIINMLKMFVVHRPMNLSTEMVAHKTGT